MDFWDLFIDKEEINNAAAIQYMGDRIPNFYQNVKNLELFVYADFVYLDDMSKQDFLTALILLSNIDKLKDYDYDADLILLLYKFYYYLFKDFKQAGVNLDNMITCRLANFNKDKYLLDNFQNSLETYSNFAEADVESLEEGELSGKLIILFRKKIFIYYLKERS